MSTPSREFLMVVEESAYKTPVVSPVVWTTANTYGLTHASAYYARLAGDNQFTMRPRPTGIVRTPYGGGVAVDAYTVADKIACQGQLTIPLSIGQAPFWLSWPGSASPAAPRPGRRPSPTATSRAARSTTASSSSMAPSNGAFTSDARWTRGPSPAPSPRRWPP